MPEKSQMDGEDEVMRRCRRARQELFARFKTPDEMHAWLMSLEKQARPRRGVKTATTRAHGKARPAARNGKAANRKPVHRA